MKQQRSGGIPLQWVLIVPFVLQVCLAVGLTGWFSWQSGQLAVQDVVAQLQSEISDRIQDRTQSFLKIPAQIDQINAGEININQLDINNNNDVDNLIHQFLTLQEVFTGINHISLGQQDGSYLAVRRTKPDNPSENLSKDSCTNLQDPFKILISNPQEPGRVYIYCANQQGDRTELKRTSNYDPRVRPWYLKAVQSGKPGWSDLYTYADFNALGIAHIHPFYAVTSNSTSDPLSNRPSQFLTGKNSGQTLAGVLATDFDLSSISKFLQSLRIGKTGQAFIIERNLHLVASSEAQDLLITEKEQTLCATAKCSRNQLIQEGAAYLQLQFPNLHQIDRPQKSIFQTSAGKQFLQVIPLVQEEGLDWLLVVVIPKNDFMGQIKRNAYLTIGLCFLVLVISSLIGFLIYRQLSSWILRFSYAAQAIAAGQLTAPNPNPDNPRIRELRILDRAFAQMRQQLQDSFTALEQTNRDLEARVEQRTYELQKANHTLHQLATIDALTGAANRRYFNDYLDQEWQRGIQEQRPLALILCDVDCFKIYNDTYGHQAGDLCLQKVVVAIRQVVQRPADLVTRYGGEEFAVILPNTELEGAKHIAADILRAVSDLQIPHRRSPVLSNVTVSLGVCSIIPSPELSQELLIKTADMALYDAKAAGRNTYEVRSLSPKAAEHLQSQEQNL